MKPAMRRMAFTLLVVILLPVALLAAQKKNEDASSRSVQGTITSPAGPVAGAVVQLKNTKSLQIRSFITKEQGEFYFNSLSPDVDYEIHAMYNGASSPTKTLSSFDSRKQAIINLKLDK